MVAVIIAAIIALIGIGLLLGSRAAPISDDRTFLKLGGGVALVIAVLVVLLGSITTVGANKVGVVTSFGRYQGTVGSGIHMMAPWSDVEEFGTRIQPLEMGVPIRFQGNSGGTANLLVEWRIEAANEAAIKRLWSDYRTFDAVQNRVVQSNTRNALNVVLAGYTPSEGIAGTALQPITDATLAGVQKRLSGTGVIVERVTIRQIDPDLQSQDRINRQVQAEADLERTATTKRIAEQEAETAAIRQRSQTPSSLQYECIRVMADWDVSRQGPMPQTLNCNFGGQANPVIVGR
jgi:regulator of protease activity HflC (stomatin/prohibitin superfamily)